MPTIFLDAGRTPLFMSCIGYRRIRDRGSYAGLHVQARVTAGHASWLGRVAAASKPILDIKSLCCSTTARWILSPTKEAMNGQEICAGSTQRDSV